MRYIPERSLDVVFQVPENLNSYINVLNVGATGLGNIEFTGTITDIQNDVVSVGGIQDGLGGTLSNYRQTLIPGVDIELFAYGTSTLPQTPLIGAGSPTVVGVDFSSSTSVNPNLAALTYIIFGYDIQTGILPQSKLTIPIGTKVLNPNFWNIDQYVQLNLSRSVGYAVPIVYRVWGNTVKFLGVIGNNKVGYPGSGSLTFRDLGLTEIPSWQPTSVLPGFMSGLFSVAGTNVTQLQFLRGKSRVTIEPELAGSELAYIRARGDTSRFSSGDTVRFYIDDTKYVQEAIGRAVSGRIKEVFFPAGTYNIRDTFFTNSDGVGLRGVGDSSTIRRLPSAIANGTNSGLLRLSGPGIRIQDVTIDGNSTNTFSAVSPIGSELSLSVNNSDGVLISGVNVIDSGGGGISLDSSSNVTFTGNRIVRTGRPYEQSVSPVLFTGCDNIVAQGNIFQYSTTSPKVVSTDFSTVNGNIIRGCGDKGLEILASSQWNAQGNLAYSDNDSIIRSIDTYNNEYSRATIEVRKGFALDPVYMTVTYGGESVSILENSIEADIYTLNSSGVKNTKIGSFRVIETSAQLEAGIFSVTLPGTVPATPIPATGSLNNQFGYMYEVKADVLIGNIRPLSIRKQTIGTTTYTAIRLRNSSDLLSFQIYSESSPENDQILIRDFSNTNLEGWVQTERYGVIDIDTITNSILLANIPALASLTSTPVDFVGGTLYIIRSNYFVADGNLYVHTF
jgi:hypothetical protein